MHEVAQKWEILNYHLKVICTDNQEHISPPVLETDAYLMREEAYRTISIVNKLFRHFGFITKQSPDYNSFQGFIYLYNIQRTSGEKDNTSHGVPLVDPSDVLVIVPI